MLRKLGNIFRMLMRLCYIKHGRVCWCCGSVCGFESTVSRGLFWCNHCFSRWGYLIKSDLSIGWRGIGRKNKIKAVKGYKAALEAA